MLLRIFVLAGSVLLMGAQSCPVAIPPPTPEEACLDRYRTWAVLGLEPEQVLETPDQLLKATLSVGETAPLRVATLAQAEECGALISAVAWRSITPDVADIVPEGLLGRLEARSPGETVVWADVTLHNGETRRAELYGTPAGRSALLRVYAVRVTR